MKTKNVMLGAIAAVIAVGGSFASTLVPALSVKPTASTCRTIDPVECGTGSNVCQVKIGSTGQVLQAYLDAACVTPIGNATASIKNSEFNP